MEDNIDINNCYFKMDKTGKIDRIYQWMLYKS